MLMARNSIGRRKTLCMGVLSLSGGFESECKRNKNRLVFKHNSWICIGSYFELHKTLPNDPDESIEAISLFFWGHHLVGTVFLRDMRQTLRIRLRARRNAPTNLAVSR